MAKAVSQLTIAKALGIDRKKVSWGLTNDARLPAEECQRIQRKADEMGYKRPIAGIHHNSALTPETASSVVEGVFLGEGTKDISTRIGVAPDTARKFIRGIEVPADYPETEDEWRSQVVHFMEVALWKGTRRLATTAMDDLQPQQIPISSAILVDKLSLMKGQPTSFSVQVHQTINHREFLDELKGAKQAQVVDVDGSE